MTVFCFNSGYYFVFQIEGLKHTLCCQQFTSGPDQGHVILDKAIGRKRFKLEDLMRTAQ